MNYSIHGANRLRSVQSKDTVVRPTTETDLPKSLDLLTLSGSSSTITGPPLPEVVAQKTPVAPESPNTDQPATKTSLSSHNPTVLTILEDPGFEFLSGEPMVTTAQSQSLSQQPTTPENSQVFQSAMARGVEPANKPVLDGTSFYRVDTFTTELAKEKGYDKPPTVVEPGGLESMVAEGKVGLLLFRGQRRTANESLLNGPKFEFRHSTGRSTFGPGLYASSSFQEAEGYVSSRDSEKVNLLKMGLKKGARVANTEELSKMLEVDRKALETELQTKIAKLESQAAKADPVQAAQLRNQIEAERKSSALKDKLLFGTQGELNEDYSRYAINKGYDAIDCLEEFGTYNVLNRSALVIERPE